MIRAKVVNPNRMAMVFNWSSVIIVNNCFGVLKEHSSTMGKVQFTCLNCQSWRVCYVSIISRNLHVMFLLGKGCILQRSLGRCPSLRSGKHKIELPIMAPRNLEEFLYLKLMKSPAFHRFVRKVYYKVNGIDPAKLHGHRATFTESQAVFHPTAAQKFKAFRLLFWDEWRATLSFPRKYS